MLLDDLLIYPKHISHVPRSLASRYPTHHRRTTGRCLRCLQPSSMSRAAGTRQVERSPSFLSRKSLVEQSQDLGHVELYIFEVESFLIIFLHLQKIVQFEVKLE